MDARVLIFREEGFPFVDTAEIDHQSLVDAIPRRRSVAGGGLFASLLAAGSPLCRERLVPNVHALQFAANVGIVRESAAEAVSELGEGDIHAVG